MRLAQIHNSSPTLLLNNHFQPIDIRPWTRALGLIDDGKAWLVSSYEGMELRAGERSFAWPAVVALYRHAKPYRRMPLTRANLLARDLYTCQYCGEKPRDDRGRPILEKLDMEHVIPRAQAVDGRVWLPWAEKWAAQTCWENLVASCKPCNNLIKRDMTPSEAGLTLARRPRKPSPLDALWIPLVRERIPNEWEAHAPDPWRGYWDVELDPT